MAFERLIYLSEHLKAFSLVRASPTQAKAPIEALLRRYDGVTVSHHTGWSSIVDALSPLTVPVATSCVIAALDSSWSLVLSGFPLSDGAADASQVTRRLKVDSATVRFCDRSRWWQVVSGDGSERVVYVQRDNSRWEFYEVGRALVFEDTDRYQRDSTEDRLSSELVLHYVSTLTGIAMPIDWPRRAWNDVVWLRRSMNAVENVQEIELVDDVTLAEV